MPPPPLHIPARREEARHERRRPWPALLLFLAMIAACSLLALGVAGWSYQRGKIMPGVETLGISLGGQSVENAARQLENDWNARRAVLRAEDDSSLTLPLVDLGIFLDAEATARAAYRQGRDIGEPQELLRALLGGAAVQPIWYFDPAVARNSLGNISTRFEIQPVNAGVEVVDGAVRATPASAGRRLDIDATTLWLQQNAVRVAFGEPLQLVLQPVEAQVVDVGALVDQLNQRLSAPLLIRAFDPVSGETETIEIAPATWAKWLTIDVDTASTPAAVNWRVDETRVNSFVEAQTETLGQNRYFESQQAAAALVQAVEQEQQEVRLRVYHQPSQHSVQSGETLSSIAFDYGIPYPWIQHANPGLGDALSIGQIITIPSPDELLPLPVVENKRIIVSMTEQRMWAYENGALKWDWAVSTGIDSSPTAPGIFQIQSHVPNAYAQIWDLWMPQFMGIYRPVPTSDFMNGFHGFPTRNGVNLLWTNSIGRKVTYGCILVSNDNIALLYDWAEEGVIVEVRP